LEEERSIVEKWCSDRASNEGRKEGRNKEYEKCGLER
jgi:hypothetical protein